MDKSIGAALQLLNYGLTPIPLLGKRPILKNWPSRFLDQRIQATEIINGIVDQDDKIITYKNKNIGIITGSVSDCIVLDIDDLSTLTKLKKMGDLPLTWRVRSNRGIHLYFKYNQDIPSMKLWDSIDILSDKKQVVAPPSIHPKGTVYRWELSPKQVEKADLPLWIVEYIFENRRIGIFEKSSTMENKLRTNLKSNAANMLLENVDWIDFYSRFTNNIKGNSEWLSSKCPFHQDKHNSFSFNIKNGAWKCFAGCGSGNGFSAVQTLYKINFQQALKVIKGEDLIV
ncbi:bifunctional DNA primase/polymerase [Bacillus sp. ISL-45]|uniref:bifunctional DNA primase/polymerase n=1 Tax=Bacillus sp. ISL-45 TaxID=2819128 RepID=UPI001BE83486|nr:bifunctional DNA primase/polymerase [Bacillus sp. ISL-45]MBT2663853.1 bifunctional DNA primase/polymerase [Bacillus sp. ISL-45]